MRDASPGGILLGSAVLFVILWEIRSALGLLVGVDTNGAAYFVGTIILVGFVAFGLSVGLFQVSAMVFEERRS
ncbi:hypothetical protein [Halonotius roseus]|jgi:uncharacterized membrane protein YdbT with pleckstrin-like domain|uniref:Uncharacterized protein n=1 Tax=Halonotius roseus TaxID=2511997 RepID=A0A544QMM9_9EURY|nr:hypothetical protein [Halonotius roseus]TQQ80167.1 hypothetical protein EWF95_06635 [Halonotius roseus]